MAKKAVASSSKVQPGLTFSQAAANTAAKTNTPFTRTECAVSLEKHLPAFRLPRPAGQYPVFFDLRSTTASQEDIVNALPHSLLGFVFREDKHVVEADCTSAEEQAALLKSPIDIPGHTPLTPLPPQTDLPCNVVGHLSSSPLCPRRKKKASTGRPAAATADSGVSSGSATAATTSGRRRRPRSRRSSKAAATVEIPTGDFTIDAPLPKPTTPPTDSRSFLPSFTTAIQAPSTMDLDCNKTPPPPPSY